MTWKSYQDIVMSTLGTAQGPRGGGDVPDLGAIAVAQPALGQHVGGRLGDARTVVGLEGRNSSMAWSGALLGKQASATGLRRAHGSHDVTE